MPDIDWIAWRKKNQIKPLYRVKNKIILPEFLYYKITYLKTHINLNNLYESYADFAITVM